jgi:hypothetical protein
LGGQRERGGLERGAGRTERPGRTEGAERRERGGPVHITVQNKIVFVHSRQEFTQVFHVTPRCLALTLHYAQPVYASCLIEVVTTR